MNPAFKSKYDQMREGKPTEPPERKAALPGNDDNYSEAGHIRNLCFIWPDGKRQFFNYSYLVSGEYFPQNNSILLEFTTHVIKLSGRNLQNLYESIMTQITLRIICVDKRYNALEKTDKIVVNKIEITKNG